MFVPTMTLFQSQTGVAESQQQSVVILDRMRNALLATLPETISVTPDGRAIGWRPVDRNSPFNDVGTPNLLGHFEVYRWDSVRQELHYTPWAPSAHDFMRTTCLPVALFPTGMTPKTRVAARKVIHFQVTSPVSFPLELEITVNPTPDKPRTAWTLREKITAPVGLMPE